MITVEQMDAVRILADHARRAYEGAASMYAVRLSQLAALTVREKIPTAALLVFDKDEDTATCETKIEVVSVRDCDGADLGDHLDWTTEQLARANIRAAYDAAPGFYPIADMDTYDTETVGSQWQDKNLLVLHIDTMLA